MLIRIGGQWVVAQVGAGVFLARGLATGADLAGFVLSHALAVGLTHLLSIALLGSHPMLKSMLLTRGFACFLLSVAAIPLIGPAVCLFLLVFLRYGTLYPVRLEFFQKVSRDVLLVIQRRLASRSIPVTEALLIRGLSREDAMRMVGVIGELEWKAPKASILRYIIRLCPYQNVIQMAVDLLRQKMDDILAAIVALEAAAVPDAHTCHQIASLYHEIDYLNLSEPLMKRFYQQRACDYAVKAYRLSRAEDGALAAVRYLLEADRVEEAKTIYNEIRGQGTYFFPKWISYEFEFSVRLDDRNLFNDLYLLIESGGGIFIPARVQQAARAWQKLLTSAWL